MAAATPIFPTEPEVTALSSLSPLPAGLADNAFREGLSFNEGVECAGEGVATWPPDCNPDLIVGDETDEEATDTWKTVTHVGDTVDFKPFLAYLFLDCPAGWLTPQIDTRRAQQLKTTFDAAKHQAIAKQLWYGVSNNDNPSLFDSAAVVTNGATAELPTIAISRLLQAHKDKGTGQTFIHGPWALVPHLAEATLIERKNGRFEGLGFVYVVDEGYPLVTTAGPIETPPSTHYADVADTCWIYASGKVEYAWGAEVNNETLGIDPNDDGVFSKYTVWDHRKNRSLLRIEQSAFLRFDPCSVLAQRVTLPT